MRGHEGRELEAEQEKEHHLQRSNSWILERQKNGPRTELSTPRRNIDPGSSALHQLVPNSTRFYDDSPRKRVPVSSHGQSRSSIPPIVCPAGGATWRSMDQARAVGSSLLRWDLESLRMLPKVSPVHAAVLRTPASSPTPKRTSCTVILVALSPRVYSTFPLLSIRLFLELTASFTLLAK